MVSPAEATVTVTAAAAVARATAPATVSRTCNGDLRLVCLLITHSSNPSAILEQWRVEPESPMRRLRLKGFSLRVRFS
ncbi:hypothetical protein GCM10027075_51910 [Streptomyces heilongjiangensis]